MESRGRISNRKRILVCLLAPFMGLILAEVGVRVLGVGPAPPPDSEGNLFETVEDPILLYTNAASSMKTLHYRAGAGFRGTVVMRTNAQRFRGNEVPLEKPDGVTRVVCLGDSHTWGDGVSEREAWPAQLQNLAGDRVQVMNCGVSGYDTLQEALWYEEYVERFDPDVVLLGYFANDVAARGLQDPTQTVEAAIRWTHPRRPGWVMDVRQKSVLADVVLDAVFRWRRGASQENNWTACHTQEGPGWIRAREALLRLRDRCAAKGRDFRVVMIPALVPSSEGFVSHGSFEVVSQFCADEGIACFDGEAALLGIMEPGNPHGLRVSTGD
ncbi:MAG: GDSL-type esterase/lipase family protein, partial [Planctomycetota bacterium]|nr:GDSL-type esterase/lipase family protein [Planctomycetota bacterium]